jgi:hypothetical protein
METTMENTQTTMPVLDRRPQRPRQFLSGTGVKIAGIILMTMDHVHQMFNAQGAPDWLTWFGRPVAVMFLFLCAEGFCYTRSKKRYMLQLLGGSLFMSAMNQILSKAMPVEHIVLINNIFGTLFLAAFYMWMIDNIREGFKDKRPAKILFGIGGFLLTLAVSLAMILALQSENRIAAMILLCIPNPITVEGGFVLVLMGLGFYLLRKYRLAQAAMILVISALLLYFSGNSGDVQWLMVFAIIPLLLYNVKRGSGGKYLFYGFYPAHIYLFYCIAWFLNGRA